MRRNVWLIATLFAVAALGCSPSEPEPNAFLEAQAVRPYFNVEPGQAYSFFAGPYKGGSAVRGPDGDAYWVKDGQGYTVNDLAKKQAPDLPVAPAEITYGPEFEEAIGYTPPEPAAP